MVIIRLEETGEALRGVGVCPSAVSELNKKIDQCRVRVTVERSYMGNALFSVGMIRAHRLHLF